MVTIRDVRGVVVDIEGTTSATESVHVGLYDFARPRIEPWLQAHADDPAIADAVASTIADAGLPADASTSDVAHVLLRWMDADVKATPLKTVQGQIWAAGFAEGALTPHFFDDVAPALRGWHRVGLGLAVFSSGSVAVQRPWFERGLPPEVAAAFVDFYDTVNAGNKREAGSYVRIASDLTARWKCTASQLLFLSDVPAELDAARLAGWRTVGVRRAGEPNAGVDFGVHQVVEDFASIEPEMRP